MRTELSPARKLAAFGAAVLAALAAGWGVGAAVDPIIEPEPPQHEVHEP